MKRAEITYRAEMLGVGALHSGGGVGGARIDRRVISEPSGAGGRRPFVPGSHVRGVCRDRMEKIVASLGESIRDAHRYGGESLEQGKNPVERVFDPGAEDAITVFSDLRPAGDREPETELRTHVSLDRRRGTHAEHKLYDEEVSVVEVLEGQIVVNLSLDQQARRDLGLLAAALLSVDGLGGGKSKGLGMCRVRVVSLSLEGEELDADQLVSEALTGEAEGSP